MTATRAGPAWRLLVTEPLDGATNMAVDHAIAQLQRHSQTPPTLRLYRWSPACLTVGAFQPLRAEVDVEACRAQGVPIVRRPTGGRAILHDQELTYAVVAPDDLPLVSGLVLESYRKISQALVHGMRLLDVEAELAPEPGGAVQKSAACFDLPSAYEVTVHGRKIMGSAQTRRRGTILQHGSLLLHADPAALARCLLLPEGLTPAELGARIVGLDELLGRPVAFEEVAEALAEGFRRRWDVELVPGPLTPEEDELARQLRREKYATDEWTSFR